MNDTQLRQHSSTPPPNAIITIITITLTRMELTSSEDR